MTKLLTGIWYLKTNHLRTIYFLLFICAYLKSINNDIGTKNFMIFHKTSTVALIFLTKSSTLHNNTFVSLLCDSYH